MIFNIVYSISIVEWNLSYKKIKYDKTCIENYKSIYPILKSYGPFMYNYGTELIDLGYYNEGKNILEQTKKIFNDNLLYVHLGMHIIK